MISITKEAEGGIKGEGEVIRIRNINQKYSCMKQITNISLII